MNPALKSLIDQIASQPSLSSEETDMMMEQAMALTRTTEERKEAGEYLHKAISRRKRPDIDVKTIMKDALESLNLSYIAKCYFNKDRTWLYQRLNNSLVNGRAAAFSEAEIKILSEALNETGHLLQQISFNLTHQNS